MSATLPNLNVLSFWLDAELYHTDFRPVPLHEMYKVGPAVYDSKTHKLLRDLAKDSITFANDSDHTISLTIETVASGTGVLVFCPSKNWCETLATSIAREIFNTGKPTQEGHSKFSVYFFFLLIINLAIIHCFYVLLLKMQIKRYIIQPYLMNKSI